MINLVDEFILFDCVQFTRRDWRNRNKIKTPRGPEWLTIPVESKGNFLARIEDIQTSNENWASEHWKTITHNYSKTSYFADYRDGFEEVFKSFGTRSLSEINRRLIEHICGLLGITTKISTSSDYNTDGDKNSRLINLCLQANANSYLSGPAAKSYVDEELFRQHGIEVKWMDYEGYPHYQQQFPPFEHGVTILDLLFNEGPDATKYMNSFAADGQSLVPLTKSNLAGSGPITE